MQKFEKYEQVARYLLNKFKDEFKLDEVEGKQTVQGVSTDTSWEIDGKAVCEGKEAFLVVECKRYTTSRINQGEVGKLAFTILDSQAKGGIFVSPLGFQSGATKVANQANILEIHLSSESSSVRLTDNYFK